MSRATDDLYLRLAPIFRDVFDDDSLELNPNMTASDVPEWDSLSHIRLIVSVEKELDIRFTTAEIASLDNVGQFVALVRVKLG